MGVTREENHNGSFKSSIGFVLACVGSAVGLGNIWLFPYRLGQYGGAAFLIPYFLFVALFGFIGLSAEFAIGRKARTGTLGSYELCWKGKKFGKAGASLGYIPLIGSLGIAMGYAVIIGWVLRYFFGALTGAMFENAPTEYFARATGEFGSLPWHIAIVSATVFLLLTGAVKKIEQINKIMIPVFFCLFVLLAVRVAFLPGASKGYEFLFVPRWEMLLQVDTWVMAMGQAFFSLSITGSGMIVYGAYLNKKEDILKSSMRTAVFDTLAAVLSALAIIPAVFAFGIEPGAGPSLMFLTVPGIFRQIPMGNVLAAFFYLAVLLAGLTSLINMFEAVIESLQHKFSMNRRVAVGLCGFLCLLVGVFIESEAKVGSFMDFITIVVVPFGALFGAISIYYALGKGKIEEELAIGRKKKVPAVFGIAARYLYVPLTVLIFILGLVYRGIG